MAASEKKTLEGKSDSTILRHKFRNAFASTKVADLAKQTSEHVVKELEQEKKKQGAHVETQKHSSLDDL